MSYDTFVGRRQARIVTLLERNPSVRRFMETLVRELDAHATGHRSSLDRVLLDDPVVANVTGDEVLRARILLKKGPP